MAKTKISEYDATAANNTDIDSINIAEGMAPSNVNNAIRQLMAHLNTEFFKTGSNNTSLGDGALDSLDGSSPGGNNVAIGKDAGTAITTGVKNTFIGGLAGQTQTAASGNTAVGYNAMQANTTGSGNTALGSLSLDANTTGINNTSLGRAAMTTNTSGGSNVGVGVSALEANSTGSDNVAVGINTLGANTTASNNTAVGKNAMISNTTASNNTAVGYQAAASNTTGTDNVSIGKNSFGSNTTGSSNVAIGENALGSNSTASSNTAVGYQAGFSNTTGASNTFLGRQAGLAVNTGSSNTYVGPGTMGTATTGSSNTVIGGFNGNQNGVDLRTNSNNIVLSDGDGNPRAFYADTGNTKGWLFSTQATPTVINASDTMQIDTNQTGFGLLFNGTSGTTAMRFFNQSTSSVVGSISFSGSTTTYSTSSDYRLKENVTYDWDATTRLKQLKPSQFNFIADADKTVDGFLAHEVSSIVPEAITGTKDAVDDDGNPVYQGIDQSKLVPLLVKTIQELEARITALENA